MSDNVQIGRGPDGPVYASKQAIEDLIAFEGVSKTDGILRASVESVGGAYDRPGLLPVHQTAPKSRQVGITLSEEDLAFIDQIIASRLKAAPGRGKRPTRSGVIQEGLRALRARLALVWIVPAGAASARVHAGELVALAHGVAQGGGVPRARVAARPPGDAAQPGEVGVHVVHVPLGEALAPGHARDVVAAHVILIDLHSRGVDDARARADPHEAVCTRAPRLVRQGLDVEHLVLQGEHPQGHLGPCTFGEKSRRDGHGDLAKSIHELTLHTYRLHRSQAWLWLACLRALSTSTTTRVGRLPSRVRSHLRCLRAINHETTLLLVDPRTPRSSLSLVPVPHVPHTVTDSTREKTAMFENYAAMSDDEKTSVKRMHKELRKDTGSRYGNLVWGFVRGFPYRRIERTVREGNEPDARFITYMIACIVTGFAVATKSWWDTQPHPEIVRWLKDPAGAIPAPKREKRPYIKPTVAA